MKKIFLVIFLLLSCTQLYAANGTIALPATPGTALNGEFAGDYAGELIISVGDVNGDRISDFLISARNFTPSSRSGRTYLVYGQPTGLPTSVNLSAIGTIALPGVKITGPTYSSSGASIISAGDINKDGLKDFLISSPGQSSVYLIYGSKNFPSVFNLNDVGSSIAGAKFMGVTGNSLASGDINGDGFVDLLFATGPKGEVFLVYGKTNLTGTITLNATNSVYFNPNTPGSVVSVWADDVNKDGYKDILLAAIGNRTAYIIFGKFSSLTSADLVDSYFNGINAVKLVSNFASNISSIGDINRDGFKDIAVRGTVQYSLDTKTTVILGKQVWGSTLNLNTQLDGTNGFTVLGLKGPVDANSSAASAGDYNNDGTNDVIFGDYTNNRAVILFGKATWPATYSLISNPINGTQSVQFTGAGFVGTSVGFLDNVFGGDGCGINQAYVFGAPGYGNNQGKAYIVNVNK